MTELEIAKAIHELPQDMVEWDAVVLAKKLQPVLTGLLPNPDGILESLTLVSTAHTFEDATGLSKAECAALLGITPEQLDTLLGGSMVRFAYKDEYGNDTYLYIAGANGYRVVIGNTLIVEHVGQGDYNVDFNVDFTQIHFGIEVNPNPGE